MLFDLMLSPRSPIPYDSDSEPAQTPVDLAEQQDDGDGTVAVAQDSKAMEVWQDPAAFEFALRDAAARFEETRRLAADNAQARQEIERMKVNHEVDLRNMVERETGLQAQLLAAQQELRDAESRELTEMGAKAQVADWRAKQSQKTAEDADGERKRALETLRAVEADSKTLSAELDKAKRALETSTAEVHELQERESDLAKALDKERSDRQAEVDRISGAASQAIGEAASDAMAARREQNDALHKLNVEAEQRQAAEAVAEALHRENAKAEQRAAQAEATLAVEKDRMHRMRDAYAEKEKLIKEANEKLKTECEYREAKARETVDQQAAMVREQLATQLAEFVAERKAHEHSIVLAMAEAKETQIELMIEAFGFSAMGDMARRARRAAFLAWRARITDEREYDVWLKRQLKYPLIILSQRQYFLAIRSWVYYIEESKIATERAKGVARVLVHQGIMRGWRSWRYFNDRVAWLKRMLQRAVRTLSARGFRSWVDAYQFVIWQKETRAWAAGALRNRKERRAFNKWLEPDLYDARKRTLDSLVQQAARAMLHRDLARAVNTFAAYWRARVEVKRSMRETLKMLSGRSCRRGWNAWLENATAERRLRSMLVAGRWFQRGRAYRKWLDVCEQADHRDEMMRWAAGALWHIGARRAFSKWIEPDLYDERKRTLDSMIMKAAKDLKDSRRRRAINSLVECWQESISVKRRRLMTIKMLSGRSCRRAWNSWQENAARIKLLKRHLAVAKWFQKGRGYRTWVYVREQAEHRSEMMRWAVGALWHRGARRGFSKWLEPDLYDARKKARDVILTQSIVALRQRNLHRAINSWTVVWRKRVDIKQSMARVIANWRGLRHRRGWNSWAAQVALRKRLRGMLRAGLWYQRARALRAWAAHSTSSQWWEDSLMWAIGAMRHRRCRTAFTVWAGPYKYDDRKRYLTSLLRKSAFAFKQRDTFRAAATWSFWYRSLQETNLKREGVRKQKEHEQQVTTLKHEHATQVATLKDNHAKEVFTLNDEHSKEVASLNDKHHKKVTDMEETHHKAITKQANEHSDDMQKREAQHQAVMAELREKFRKERKEHEDLVQGMRSQHHDEVNSLTEAHEGEMRKAKGEHHDALTKLQSSLEQTDDARAAAEREAARHREDASRLQALWDARPPTPPPKMPTREAGVHPRFAWPSEPPPSPTRSPQRSPPPRMQPAEEPPERSPPPLEKTPSHDSATQTLRPKSPRESKSPQRSPDPPPTRMPLPADEGHRHGTIKKKRSVGVGPAPPPSDHLLRHTDASKRWDQSRKRHQLEQQLAAAVPWHPMGEPEKRETFSKTAFLQDPELDAIERPLSARERAMGMRLASSSSSSSSQTHHTPMFGRAATVESAYSAARREINSDDHVPTPPFRPTRSSIT